VAVPERDPVVVNRAWVIFPAVPAGHVLRVSRIFGNFFLREAGEDFAALRINSPNLFATDGSALYSFPMAHFFSNTFGFQMSFKGATCEAYMTKITGRRSPIPVVQAHLYDRDADRTPAVQRAAVASERGEPASRLPMWVAWLIVALGVVVVWAHEMYWSK
jgi:hypothetical protein